MFNLVMQCCQTARVFNYYFNFISFALVNLAYVLYLPSPPKTMLYQDSLNLKDIQWRRGGFVNDLERGRDKSVILNINRTLQV